MLSFQGATGKLGCCHTHIKVLADVIKRRTMARIEEVIAEEQAGFRPGKGKAYQIFTLYQIIERHWEYDLDVYCLFVDFQQAFESDCLERRHA